MNTPEKKRVTYLLPADFHFVLGDYLSKRPWNEVAQIMQTLMTLPKQEDSVSVDPEVKTFGQMKKEG